MVQPCPLIEISGAPFERGTQYGRQASARIRSGIGHYLAQISGMAITTTDLRDVIRDYLPIIEAFDETYIEEMRGIAVGAEVEFEDVVLLNARTEVLKLAERPELRSQLAAGLPPDGCTAIVARPRATADGALIHAHNWDWKFESAAASVIVLIRRDDGPDMLTFTEAGALGRFGFNSAGIAITANYLECERDYRRAGVPLALIRRKVLEQAHFALALRAVYVTPKSGSNNIVVSHAGGLVFNFECAPDETFMVEPDDGLLVHANHWRSPIALTKFRDTGVASFPDSLYRDVRARDLLAPKIGTLTVDDVKAALFDDFASPHSICRPPRRSAGADLSATVATLVMRPAAGLMEVAMLPAVDRAFTTYTLEMETAAVRAAGQ